MKETAWSSHKEVMAIFSAKGKIWSYHKRNAHTIDNGKGKKGKGQETLPEGLPRGKART